jgi:hypothetical protein
VSGNQFALHFWCTSLSLSPYSYLVHSLTLGYAAHFARALRTCHYGLSFPLMQHPGVHWLSCGVDPSALTISGPSLYSWSMHAWVRNKDRMGFPWERRAGWLQVFKSPPATALIKQFADDASDILCQQFKEPLVLTSSLSEKAPWPIRAGLPIKSRVYVCGRANTISRFGRLVLASSRIHLALHSRARWYHVGLLADLSKKIGQRPSPERRHLYYFLGDVDHTTGRCPRTHCSRMAAAYTCFCCLL